MCFTIWSSHVSPGFNLIFHVRNVKPYGKQSGKRLHCLYMHAHTNLYVFLKYWHFTKPQFWTSGKEQLRDSCIYTLIYLGKPQRFSYPCCVASGVYRVLHKIQSAGFAINLVDRLMVFLRHICCNSAKEWTACAAWVHSGRRDRHDDVSRIGEENGFKNT